MSLARGLSRAVLLLLSGLAILVLLDGGARAAVPDSAFPAPTLFVSPGGNDQGSCSQAAPCATWNAAYQRAKPGQVIAVSGGTYPGQVIQSRNSTADLDPGCTPETPTNCIVFQTVPGQVAFVDGPLQVNGSSVWIDGATGGTSSVPARGRTYSIHVSGYVDTEATSPTDFPDHVIVQGIKATSFGVFDVHTAVFRDMDIGPATIGAGCKIEQGDGIENKIGFAAGVEIVPTNVTLDRMIIHNQTRDEAGAESDCHFGGLFLVTANGLTIQNSVFSQNAVYNIQVQNFGGAPPATRVTLQDNWFGCPVDWLYQPAGDTTCDNQADLQFNAASFFSNWLIRHNSFGGGIWAGFEGSSFDDIRVVGNAGSAPSRCYQGMTFAYNAWERARCSSTDRRLGALPFVSSSPGSEDFHLASRVGAGALVEPDAPDAGPSTDILGQVRPLRFPSDAGAVQPDSALILPGHSIGSAVLGAPADRLAAIYGDPVKTRSVELGPDRVAAQAQIFKAPGGRLGAFIVDNTVVGLWTTSPFYSTPAGLGTGTPLADARRLPLSAWAPCNDAMRTKLGPVATSFLAGASPRIVGQVLLLRRQFVTPCRP
jgi:hypothetical protein